MKKISTLLTAFLIIVTAAMCTVSCNQFEEDRVSKTLTPSLVITDCTASQRAMASLTLMPEEAPNNVLRPLIMEYTVDGETSFIQRIIGGSLAPLNEKEWNPSFDENFKSGSILNFTLWRSHVPTCYFLMPQLPAGNHTITISLRDENDEYGAVATVSGTWTVK